MNLDDWKRVAQGWSNLLPQPVPEAEILMVDAFFEHHSRLSCIHARQEPTDLLFGLLELFDFHGLDEAFCRGLSVMINVTRDLRFEASSVPHTMLPIYERLYTEADSLTMLCSTPAREANVAAQLLKSGVFREHCHRHSVLMSWILAREVVGVRIRRPTCAPGLRVSAAIKKAAQTSAYGTRAAYEIASMGHVSAFHPMATGVLDPADAWFPGWTDAVFAVRALGGVSRQLSMSLPVREAAIDFVRGMASVPGGRSHLSCFLCFLLGRRPFPARDHESPSRDWRWFPVLLPFSDYGIVSHSSTWERSCRIFCKHIVLESFALQVSVFDDLMHALLRRDIRWARTFTKPGYATQTKEAASCHAQGLRHTVVSTTTALKSLGDGLQWIPDSQETPLLSLKTMWLLVHSLGTHATASALRKHTYAHRMCTFCAKNCFTMPWNPRRKLPCIARCPVPVISRSGTSVDARCSFEELRLDEQYDSGKHCLARLLRSHNYLPAVCFFLINIGTLVAYISDSNVHAEEGLVRVVWEMASCLPRKQYQHMILAVDPNRLFDEGPANSPAGATMRNLCRLLMTVAFLVAGRICANPRELGCWVQLLGGARWVPNAQGLCSMLEKCRLCLLRQSDFVPMDAHFVIPQRGSRIGGSFYCLPRASRDFVWAILLVDERLRRAGKPTLPSELWHHTLKFLQWQDLFASEWHALVSEAHARAF